MSSPSRPRGSRVRVLVYCAAILASYTVSWTALAGLSSRGALSLVSAWWAGLYTSLLLALRVGDLLGAAAAVLPLLLVYHLLSRQRSDVPFPVVLVAVVIQAAFILSPIAVNRIVASIVSLAAGSNRRMARSTGDSAQAPDDR